MPQYPIPAQPFAKKPDSTFAPLLANAQGMLIPANGVGNSWYVSEATGDDDNTGSAVSPFATLDAAQAAAVANNGDVVYLIGAVHVSAAVAWAKNGVSLVGVMSPSDNDRARISQTGSTVFSPLVNVTAQGCSFINIGTFHGFANASTQICWNELGGRNYYRNVQFLGMGNATAAAQAGGRSLVIGGSGENLFEGCTFGLDTITRATAANATLELIAGTPRNIIRDGIFQALVSLATDVHILIGAGGIDRYLLLQNTKFFNAVDSTATAMNAAITANAAAGGSVMLDADCLSIGATAIALAGPVYGPIGALGATTWGIGGKLT